MTSNPAYPKRAAEDYAHTSISAMPPSPKKPRFDVRNPSALAPDAPEDDAVLDADVIGGRGQNIRRNAVNIDGYDSDSENEGFDGRVETKARREREEKSKLEEENDMFADLDEDFRDGDDKEGGRTVGKGKKAVRFLEEDEIEGQIGSSKGGGHVKADFREGGNGIANGKGKGKSTEDDAESTSDSEVDDEVRASTGDDVDEEIGAGGKKTHAPKLDAFNMRNEQEEGRFDDQGNYVRKAADPDAVHDTWLEGLSKKDMKKAKEAAEKRDAEKRKRDVEDDAVMTSDLLKTLILHLEKGETLLEALARIGRGKKEKPKWQMKNRNKKKVQDGEEDVDMGEQDLVEAKRREAVETITDAADRLLTRGQPEVYDIERELLIRQYQRETGEQWVDPPRNGNDESTVEPKFWEYRWSDARDGGEIHGPYDGGTMMQWNDAGYFGEGVEFREKDSVGAWSRAVEFT